MFRAVASIAALVVASCRTPATYVEVLVQTDADPSRLFTLRACVVREGQSLPSSASLCRDGQWVHGGPGTLEPFFESFSVRPPTGWNGEERAKLALFASVEGDAQRPAVRFRRTLQFPFTRSVATRQRVFLSVQCGQASVGCTSVSASECTVSVVCEERGETCGDEGRCVSINVTPTPIPADAGADAARPDASIDSATDTGAPMDTGVAVDARGDTGVDSGMDSGIDTGVDAGSGVNPALGVPRAISPLSTSTVTSQTPTIRWVASPGIDGAIVELSRTRAFASVDVTARVTGSEVRFVMGLAPGLWFWRMRGRAGLVEGTRTSPVWWFRVGPRSAPTDTSWGTDLDVNGDGFADLAVSSPRSGRGRVDVYYGGPAGVSTTPNATVVGAMTDGEFGLAVSSAGDVNGDGYGDLIVGAHISQPGGLLQAGSAALFLGSASGLVTTPHRRWDGTAAVSFFGRSVGCAGDVNRDGYADVFIGADAAAFGGTGNVGAVSIYTGSASGVGATPHQTVGGTQSGENFGYSTSSAGDVNGDGNPDLIIGAFETNASGRTSAGTAHVLVGDGTRFNPVPQRLLEGLAANDSFGQAVAGGGDTNGDGYADVIVGAPYADTAGRMENGSVRIFLGSASGISATPQRVLDGNGAGDWFGASARMAGDLNNDGYADIVIGAPWADPSGLMNAGYAMVYLGSFNGIAPTPHRMVSGAIAGDFLGQGLANAGDTNGDGISDLVIGAYASDPRGRVDVGSVMLFRGSSSGIMSTPQQTLEGTNSAEWFGIGVASVRRVPRWLRFASSSIAGPAPVRWM